MRQYFPKGMALTDITEEQVQETVERSTTDLEKYLDLEPRMRYSLR
ncbi:protein of unknown function [Candidatus Nitrotoga arctica]|uniref:Uncharacterized protein n=1 Tax=Candidatus Nitrotoga arctica TaxID=453162 RepID=A0ABM8Z0I2_9PROT|nr:protein of unknown function [Candidatus Nitrotoga arctica]